MSDRMEEIRARLAAATPGRWEAVGTAPGNGEVLIKAPGYGVPRASVTSKHDAALIVNAKPDLAWCLAEIERLRGHADALEALITPPPAVGGRRRVASVQGFHSVEVIRDVVAAMRGARSATSTESVA